MSIRFVSEEEVTRKLPSLNVKEALRKAFIGLAKGKTIQPGQTVTLFPDDKGDCIFYPGVLGSENVVGVKLSPYIVERTQRGLYPVTAYTLLLSAETGEPILLCDSLLLTTARTAATTALALEYLTRPDAAKLAVIGAGKVAQYHLKYVKPQHSWQSMTIYAPSLSNPTSPNHITRRNTFKAEFAEVVIKDTAEEAVWNADVVMLCTSSATPVIKQTWLKEDVTVTSITTNAPKAHEIEPAALSNFHVFCDYRKTAPLSAGEMILAKEQYGWDGQRIIADLPELVTGVHNGVEAVSGKVFFRSIGLGLEDLAIAQLLA